MASGLTDRERAKADRQAALLQEASRLFAERGFSGASLEDVGAAVGVSGPAVYRHFANKQALLGAILVRVSERLRAGGERVVKTVPGAPEQLTALIRFHVDFALTDADVIRVQDRDLASLSEDDRHRVRRLQREYVEVWIAVLRRLHPGRSEQELRVRAHAVFGLINSTPHSVRGVRGAPGEPAVRAILQEMAAAALSA
ncbi:MAG: TetR family transcriptional regulator [Microbacterium sp.]|uniref:SACE_7040 family transcriptional regulator n=1 Tax=Microbacterium sp. TaxID=51671 RepID=UPI00092B5CFF|nr:TetR/AcrR family transcriptional regulator [Microbacterium sp.]OJU61227.1 MAG: TetR family transcriptional regulator [Microbacterium sp. 70-38]MBN9152594.1 TetR family transcriptional regulator [Microbacterium sp.]MBN9169866.1 TetR family transcriptional regulator [Microbacterium sp.]MBN9170697.1 TetR family transcriptional regulator [Microbacterium sp.]MBN9175416.1 TetR family transcriptional regulator [Microbacterium sp.]